MLTKTSQAVVLPVKMAAVLREPGMGCRVKREMAGSDDDSGVANEIPWRLDVQCPFAHTPRATFARWHLPPFSKLEP